MFSQLHYVEKISVSDLNELKDYCNTIMMYIRELEEHRGSNLKSS